MCSSVAGCGESEDEYVIHQKMGVAAMDQWIIWLGRLGALGALVCAILGLIVGFSDDLTWKLGARGWFAGGAVTALLAIVMYLEDAAAARKQ